MDALTPFLDILRLRSQLFGRLEFSAPWGFTFPGDKGILIVVNSGACFLSVDEDRLSPVPLVEGDFVFLPAPHTYTLQSSMETPLRSVLEISLPESFWQSKLIHYDGGGQRTVLIAGCFNFATPAGDWLSNDLPPIIHVRAADLDATPNFQSVLRLIISETIHDAPGSTVIIDRLSEVLFIHAIRQRINATANDGKHGWISALNDFRLGEALKLMHSEPSRQWTVPDLANSISMSRSAFATQFRKQVGVTPLKHLTRWRMVYAAGLIEDQPLLKIASIASMVGYESESAFGKKFRQIIGLSPGAYRKRLDENKG